MSLIYDTLKSLTERIEALEHALRTLDTQVTSLSTAALEARFGTAPARTGETDTSDAHSLIHAIKVFVHDAWRANQTPLIASDISLRFYRRLKAQGMTVSDILERLVADKKLETLTSYNNTTLYGPYGVFTEAPFELLEHYSARGLTNKQLEAYRESQVRSVDIQRKHSTVTGPTDEELAQANAEAIERFGLKAPEAQEDV